MKIKTTLFILATVLFGNLILAQGKSTNDCPVIPMPVVYQIIDGNFDIYENILQVNTINLPLEIGNYFEKQLKSAFSITSIFKENQGRIIFKKIKNVPHNSYSINVADNITITYSSEESCFYAINTFLQLIEQNEGNYFIKKGFIQDSPKFNWRGMHLDVSRHFFTVDEVKHFIDLMALYKFNTLHWHLTDDQGWRIEIKQFPKLTEIGAWRDSTLIGHYNDKPRKYEKKKTGGFYTQEQIKDVVDYAQKRFISIVPEIEMPGHCRAALAAYPEYSCTEKQQPVPGLWGVFDDIYCSKPESIDFNKKILDEVIPLFPSEYIHIGGDEAPKTRWHECPRCQKVIKENGLKDEHELQSFFIKQMDDYLTSKGKKLIGWDEILEGGLSPNAVVMSWRGEAGGIEAAKQKHFVIMSPTNYCYFDHYQSGNSNEPLAIGGFLPLEKVYQFNPIPKGLTYEEESYILGGQANIWTEYIPTMEKLEYMTFPRALAMSQALWCREQKPSYEIFKMVLIKYQFDLLDRYKVNYSKTVLAPAINLKRNKDGLTLQFIGSNKEDEFIVESYIDSTITYCNPVTLNQKDSISLSRINFIDFNIDYFVQLKKDGFETEKTKFTINKNSTIGLPVELITQPNSKYNVRGDLALVDGIKGKRPWKGDEWLGFSTDTVEFIVDLSSKRKIKTFQLGFLDAKGSWIYVPETVQISVSNDKKKWKKISPKKATENFNQKVNKKGRFVHIQVVAKNKIPAGSDGEGNIPWTFIDELEIEYK